MALNNFGLGIMFQGFDKVTKPARDVERSFNRVDSKASQTSASIGQAVGAIGAAFAGVAGAIAPGRFLKGLADEAGEFGLGLAKVQNISSATEAQLKDLRAAAIQAGIATQFSPGEALEGLEQLASRGFQVQEQTKALLPVLDLASAQQLEVGESANIAGAAMKIYGIGVDDLGFAMDRLTRISSLTAIQSKDLRVALANSAKGAIAAKQGMTEMLVVMGLARNAGLDMSVVANSVNRGLSSISTRGQKELKRLGITVEDGQGRFRDFGDILLDVQAKTAGLSDVARAASLQKIFGQFGMTAALAAMKQLNDGVRDSSGNIVKGKKALQFLRGELNNSNGTLERFRTNLLKTFAGQKILLQGTVQTIRTVLGEPLARLFGPMVGAVTSQLNRILVWFDKLDDSTKDTIARWAALTGGVIAAVGAFVAIKAIIPLLAPVILAVKGILVGLGVVLFKFAIPILAVVGAVLLLRKAWAENWGDIRTKTAFVLAWLRGAFKVLGARLGEFWQGLKAGFNDTWRIIQPAFAALRSSLGVLWGAFGRLAEAMGLASVQGDLVAALVTGDWTEAGIAAGRGLAAAFATVVDVLATLVKWAGHAVDAFVLVGEFLGVSAAAIYLFFAETIPNAITGALRWFNDFVKMTDAWVEGLMQSLVDRVMDSVVKLARQVPASLRVGAVETLATMRLSTENAAGGTRSTPVGVRSGQFAFDAERSAALEAAVGSAGGGGPISLESRTVLEVDGEVLASTVERHNAEGAAMSFAGGG